MASQKEKFEQDAERMKSRSFAGYVKDRLTGSADFDKKSGSAPAASATPAIGGKNPANAEALKEAGFKRGGVVKVKTVNKNSSFKW